MLIVHTIQTVQDPNVKLNDYVYPPGAQAIGWMIVIVLVGAFPIHVVYYIYKKKPEMTMESIKALFQPDESWGPCETPARMLQNEKGNLVSSSTASYQTYTQNEAFVNDENDEIKKNEEKF